MSLFKLCPIKLISYHKKFLQSLYWTGYEAYRSLIQSVGFRLGTEGLLLRQRVSFWYDFQKFFVSSKIYKKYFQILRWSYSFRNFLLCGQCKGGQPCNSNDGSCSQGCEAGWSGRDCQTPLCGKRSSLTKLF